MWQIFFANIYSACYTFIPNICVYENFNIRAVGIWYNMYSPVAMKNHEKLANSLIYHIKCTPIQCVWGKLHLKTEHYFIVEVSTMGAMGHCNLAALCVGVRACFVTGQRTIIPCSFNHGWNSPPMDEQSDICLMTHYSIMRILCWKLVKWMQEVIVCFDLLLGYEITFVLKFCWTNKLYGNKPLLCIESLLSYY